MDRQSRRIPVSEYENITIPIGHDLYFFGITIFEFILEKLKYLLDAVGSSWFSKPFFLLAFENSKNYGICLLYKMNRMVIAHHSTKKIVFFSPKKSPKIKGF